MLFNAYLHFGLEAFKICEGMFSAAIWHSEKQEMVLVRDPVGIKPLYYTKNKDGFFFASEIKPLLHTGPQSIRHDLVPEYLKNRFISGNKTLFSTINKVPPGSAMTVNNTGKIRTKIYWSPHSFLSSKNINEEQFHRELSRSLELTSQSELPLGSLPSGGLDSSLVNAHVRASGGNLSPYFF